MGVAGDFKRPGIRPTPHPPSLFQSLGMAESGGKEALGRLLHSHLDQGWAPQFSVTQAQPIDFTEQLLLLNIL